MIFSSFKLDNNAIIGPSITSFLIVDWRVWSVVLQFQHSPRIIPNAAIMKTSIIHFAFTEYTLLYIGWMQLQESSNLLTIEKHFQKIVHLDKGYDKISPAKRGQTSAVKMAI